MHRRFVSVLKSMGLIVSLAVVGAMAVGCAAGEMPPTGVDPTPTPQPANGNEPASLRDSMMLDLNMSSKTLGTGFAYSQGWQSGNVTIESDPGAPRSAPGVLEYAYNVGFSDQQGSPGSSSVRWSGGGRKTVYVSYWVKIKSPWQYHSTGVNKLFFIGSNAQDANNAEFVCSVLGANETVAQLRCAVQGPLNTGGGTTSGYYTANRATPGFALNKWHRIEVLLGRNTGGQPNGTMKWWVDGELIGEHTNVLYHPTGDALFDAITLNPNWGGNAMQLKTQRDAIYLDHVYVSGAR